MTALNLTQERADFEAAFARINNYPTTSACFDLDNEGRYYGADARDAWLIWLERAALAQSPVSAEGLERDAARYRWLRAPDTDAAMVLDKHTGWVPPDDVVPGVGGYHTYEYRAGEDLDSAIDAAIERATQGETS